MVVDHLHAGRPRDLTITAAHRAALRRIGSGEPVSELGDALGALYLHDLIRDDGGRIVLTEDGVGLLAAHDRLAETRRVERPRLEPRPLPPRWSIDIAYGVYVHEEYGPLLRLDAGPRSSRSASASRATPSTSTAGSNTPAPSRRRRPSDEHHRHSPSRAADWTRPGGASPSNPSGRAGTTRRATPRCCRPSS